MTSVNDIWRRLETHISKIDGASAELGPPASDAQIALCEATLSISLPSDFRQSLRCHDGAGRILFLVGDFRLWPIGEITRLNQRKRFNNEFSSGDVTGRVKDLINHSLWIGFGDNGGNAILAVDLDPGEKGTVGQIIVQYEDETIVLADSMRDFLEQAASEIDSGDRVWDDNAGMWSDL